MIPDSSGQTQRTPRIAIVGAGTISEYHIRGLEAAGAEVGILVSRTLATAQAKAAEFGIAKATDRIDDVWDSQDIDGIVVATPDATHKSLALAAIDHRMPSMIQKPLGLSTQECRTIVDAAATAGVPVYSSFMHRYFEEVTALRELIAAGDLGTILHVRQRNATAGAGWAPWFYDEASVGGGVVMQLGVHGIDLVRHVFGEIVSVSALIDRQVLERTLDSGAVVRPTHEDFAIATYRLASGGYVTHEVSYNEVAGTDRFRMEVYGTAGTAWLRTERGRLAIATKANPEEWTNIPLDSSVLGELHHRHFIDMVTGRSPDDGSGLDGLISVLIAEKVYEAAAAYSPRTIKW